MKKLLSLFFNQKNTNKEPKSQSRCVEGWDAYQEAKKLFFIKDKKEQKNEQALLLFDKAIECGCSKKSLRQFKPTRSCCVFPARPGQAVRMVMQPGNHQWQSHPFGTTRRVV